MNKKRNLPFHAFTHTGWQNIFLVILIIFYFLMMCLYLINLNHVTLCEIIGSDYCAFWSAGRIINENAFADVYDWDFLMQYQKIVFPQWQDGPFEILAVMYPPVFLLVFKYLSLIGLPLSFAIWTALNLIGFILYLRFFSIKTTGNPPPFRLILMFVLSFPVFINFYNGQVNLWLMVCAGEFFRATLENKDLKAGAWLGGWLLKPQILILILPYLLIKRRFKALTGFMLSAAAIGLASIALVGIKGIQNLKNILLGSAVGAGGSNPLAMMNWRMVGAQIDTINKNSLGLIITIIGTTITIAAVIIFFIQQKKQDKDLEPVSTLAIFAATCITAWHAHIHMAMFLIPPMLYLLLKKKFNIKLLTLWTFTPVFLTILSFIIAILFQLNEQIIYLTEASSFFMINLIFLGWAMFQFKKTRRKSEKTKLKISR